MSGETNAFTNVCKRYFTCDTTLLYKHLTNTYYMPVTDEHYLGAGNTEKNEVQSRSSRNQSPVKQKNNSIQYSEMVQQKNYA